MNFCRRNGSVIFLMLLVTSISRADPVLMAQLYHAHSQSAAGGLTFNFRFYTGDSVANQAEISRVPTLADIGQTFSADPANLAKFNEILTITSRPILVYSYHGIASLPREAAVHEFFDGPFMDDFPMTPIPESNQFIMKAFVPQLGPNLSGYRITDVRQTIDGMSIRQLNANTFIYWGAHTIRIFGEQIPEPSTCLLVALCLAMLPVRIQSPQWCR